jgi:DNA-binding HxlR family transcriptional regulator
VQKEVNTDSLAPAIRLLHRRWSVPVIARLHTGGPARYTDLAAGLANASRDTLAETLAELQRAGAVAHRPFHPAYHLTIAGQQLGDPAVGAVEAVRKSGTQRVALKKWPMLVLVAVGRGARRFNDVKAVLPGITSGALAPALKDLEEAGLVDRVVTETYPPAVAYRLTAAGADLFPPMDRLVRAAAMATTGPQ